MSNRLLQEQSPYLLQHAHNPVDWYPWANEPFERAEKEHKPVLVSIGYAACHWCHVMERESFEDPEVAAYMNEHFVCIKVDREEHPGVDQVYMDAVQAISGSGGWPLNVFVTPARVPFYGGTYYPPRPAYSRPSWLQILERMREVWVHQQEEVVQQSGQMLQYLRQAAQLTVDKAADAPTMDDCRETAETLLKQGDPKFGGFGRAPKFPGSMAISFLLEHYHFTKHQPSLDQALLSLDAMIQGGIYDQLGGGFARYATDERWLVPHFEKMLYDNALLLLSLCDAYQITRKLRYKEVIEETIAFVERELRDDSGLYYSALDADSEGVEGKCYTWTWEDWQALVDDELITEFYGVTPEGNWEHTNILNLAKPLEHFATEKGLDEGDFRRRLSETNARLFQARQQRIPPLTDDKSLLSWNALMNLALSKAGVILEREDYIQRAEQHMVLMLKNFGQGEGLRHVWKAGTARIEAHLDDYAYLIKAALQLAEAAGKPEWILKAGSLCEEVMRSFLHEDGVMFYYTSESQIDIPVRKVDTYDGALPSANAVMAENLALLGLCMEKNDWIEQSEAMIRHTAGAVRRYPYSFGYWALQIQRQVAGRKTVVITGSDAGKLGKALRQVMPPQCYRLTSEKEISNPPVFHGKDFSSESLIFVCTREACFPPLYSIEETLGLISAG